MPTQLADNIIEGDRVKVARHFLQSAGIVTGEIPFWTGTVHSFSFFAGGRRIANVLWDGQSGLSSYLSTNLVRVQDIQLEKA